MGLLAALSGNDGILRRSPILLGGVGVVVLLGLRGAFRVGASSGDGVAADAMRSLIPRLIEVDVTAEERSEIVDALVHANGWFNSLKFAQIEYSVSATKSDRRYQRDLERAKLSLPPIRGDKVPNPESLRVWEIDRKVTFDESHFHCARRSAALGSLTEKWDGELLTGFNSSDSSQEPNYFLKSHVGESTLRLGWFPRVGTMTLWFHDESQEASRRDWRTRPPVLVGATRFSDRACVVLRDGIQYWIVGREDGKLYGRYSTNELEWFDRHREMAEGVHWPMASVRKRFGSDGLEWTDRTLVTAFSTRERPPASVFRTQMETGVKVCDLRNDYPVVFRFDPGRTKGELEEIYLQAKQTHHQRVVQEQRSRELIGSMAPELGKGIWINSDPILMKELRGNRPLQLGFGYAGCAPCGNMLADFSRIQGTSPRQLVLVFAASDSVSSVKEKLDLYEIDCPVFIPGDDSGYGQVFDRYRVTGYPTVVEVDVSGRVESHRLGAFGPG